MSGRGEASLPRTHKNTNFKRYAKNQAQRLLESGPDDDAVSDHSELPGSLSDFSDLDIPSDDPATDSDEANEADDEDDENEDSSDSAPLFPDELSEQNSRTPRPLSARARTPATAAVLSPTKLDPTTDLQEPPIAAALSSSLSLSGQDLQTRHRRTFSFAFLPSPQDELRESARNVGNATYAEHEPTQEF